MNKIVKRLLIGLLIIATIAGAGYGGYKLYKYAVKFVTEKITKGVTKGVTEGISKGVGDTLNPFKWPGKILGQ